MAAPRDTKREILDAAESMLQERGFNGFSYHHIAERLGVKNAAVHYHFRSKNDLGVAVIERYRRRFQRWAEKLEADGADSWVKLEAFFGIYLDLLKNGNRICPSGTLQAEFHTIPETLQESVRALVVDMQAWLTRILADGRERGVFGFPGEPEDQALVLIATLQGALQIARATGPGRFEAALEQVRRQLRS
ncbi:MAG TPA: TetR/AcrR family transcriptional regulator [Thermoanaerobaculia bacterium]|nr:TetR/AcrR family transcriptional regulator [Thermoanaerobaculia bacterium]